MSHLEIDPRLCTGCRVCEQVCALAHEGVLPLHWPASEFCGGTCWSSMRGSCVHCAEADCVAACPTDALSRTGAETRLDPAACIHCGACVEVCELLFWDEGREQPLICDLCGECVGRCPSTRLNW